jgi:uncharacterized repeat protein (TIGR03803 family)
VPAGLTALIVAWETFRERIIRSWEQASIRKEKNTMKILRIPLVIVLIVVAGRTFDANAQTDTVLYSFGNSTNDGFDPVAPLVQGSDGNFYGTTYIGGVENYGTIFQISPSGTYTTLYSFDVVPYDGASPYAGLVQGRDGNFYGTTQYGGTNYDGTVFRISPSGNYTNLHSFNNSPDGANPLAGLVQGSDGNFYGTTQNGGTSGNCEFGCGTVFRISPSGTETTLYSFVGSPSDGSGPEAGLVQGRDGNFYGTTEHGGKYGPGYGTLFRLSLGGSYTNLHSFGSSANDGTYPAAALVQGSDGNLYGTTLNGGTSGPGTVFRLSPSGTYTSLYSFVGFPSNDGEGPNTLLQGSDGNFYGTTDAGGTSGNGTVFRISPSGNYTNLYSFNGSPDGATPQQAGLVQGSDGNFYGTTTAGGTNDEDNGGDGTVFSFTVSLSPPPNQISAIQKSGTNIVLAIPSVAGETYQLQYRNSLTSGSWSNVPGVSITNSIGSILTLTNFAGANQPQGFYRFDITP